MDILSKKNLNLKAITIKYYIFIYGDDITFKFDAKLMKKDYDIIVVGGGHAGIEAANAVACLGSTVLMITMDYNAIGRMSCNPAIGGVAKGQLVRDIDALGGLMGVLADQSGIQFKMLNKSKGPAVWGPRAQMDMHLYAKNAKKHLKEHSNIYYLSDEVVSLYVDNIKGKSDSQSFKILTKKNKQIKCSKIIITTGTFLGAVMYTGLHSTAGGRIHENPANELSKCLRKLGIKTRRLKTGTPSRLNAQTIDYSSCEEQQGDLQPHSFSFRTEHSLKNNSVCWITHTNSKTHNILKQGFSESPMFTGKIEGIGPRYCPSIEDKINRFATKESHQLFLEPEDLEGKRIYVNGFSSSLPTEIQKKALQSIVGLEECEILQYGYAVEYDAINSNQLQLTYESKQVEGLYFAGQVNGTSGYEEAAAQGLMAGINAHLKFCNLEPFILSRSESYVGVLTDDLVSLDIKEPYRMFTSQAEYRLFLRQDNSEERLMEKGYELGLTKENLWKKFQNLNDKKNSLEKRIAKTTIPLNTINSFFKLKHLQPVKEGLVMKQLLKRPEINLEELLTLVNWKIDLPRKQLETIEASILYSGFFERQLQEIKRVKKLGNLRIPDSFDYYKAKALSMEARNKLDDLRPLTVYQAQRVAGVTPADISALIFYLNTPNNTQKK